ncbi:MAG: ArsC family reductase [Pseudomonadota bacterium]
MITIYGIKNCDTMKKAFKWLNENNIAYDFHDYKKQGIDKAVLKQAIQELGLDSVINRRGTTWRQLDDAIKESMNETLAIEVAIDNPSIIKRPLLVTNENMVIGFKAEEYQEHLL